MEKKTAPFISVCMPSYNNALFLRQALDSVLAQTYPDFEVILGDNGSTDETPAIVRTYTDPRLRCIRREQTIGCLDHWNALINEARGDIIALYHADDVYHPEILERQAALLDAHPEVGAVFCLDRLIDENGGFVRDGIRLPRHLKDKSVLNFHDVVAEMAARSSSFLVTPSFVARREVFDRVGYFDETDAFGDSIGGAGDVEMWLRIARRFPIAILPQRLIDRRISRTQGSRQYEGTRITPANHLTVMDQCIFADGADLDARTLKQYCFHKEWDRVLIAANLIEQGRSREAEDCLKALRWGIMGNTLFYDRKNSMKTVLALLLRSSVALGLSGWGVRFLRRTQRIYNKF